MLSGANIDIYLVQADGEGQVRMTDAPGVDTQPKWSPDGSLIAFKSHRDGQAEIYTMRPDGSEQKRVTNNPELGIGPFDWSPDGESIAFVSTRDGNSNIYTLSLRTGKEEQLTDDPAADWWPSWGPKHSSQSVEVISR